jgi:superfamily I DNA/RNA helicase
MGLPNPIGRQREVLYLPAAGHNVVLGTAGSGKTVIAILRAAYLAKKDVDGKTLLVTFNKTLVTYLKALGEAELGNVDICTYHEFARGYLNSRGKMRPHAILDPDEKLSAVARALDVVRNAGHTSPILQRSAEVFVEEIQWLERNGIRSEPEYVSADRVGRDESRISRKERPFVWQVYQNFLSLRNEIGYDYDWDDLAQVVCSEFDTDTSSRRYKHIVIDEGQDFSPVMLKSLASAIADAGSLTFFGDMAQQIYGSRISWRSAGLNPPKVWYFQENYRNTRQIAKLGLAISRTPFFRGVADLVEPHSPKADGPLPTLVECDDGNKETELALENASAMGRTQFVGLLSRNRSMDNHFVNVIKSKDRSLRVEKLDRDIKQWNPEPGIFVGTYHSAKSLEFDAVILPHCNDEILPDQSRIAALGSRQEAESEEARLLYVAVTRAKTRLILTYSGSLTKLLPSDPSLYQKEKV